MASHETGRQFGLVRLESNTDEHLAVCFNMLDKTIHRFVVTADQARRLSIWVGGQGNIQDVMPDLDTDQREMCISGMSDDEFLKLPIEEDVEHTPISGDLDDEIPF